MKTILFLLVTFGCLAHAICDESAALAIINDSQPLQNGTGAAAWRSNDAAVRNLYLRQLQALRSIAESGTGSDLPIAKLIPYLNYVPSEFEAEVPSVSLINPSVEKISRTWPAFQIILSRTNAAEELKAYSLDSGNPINYRIAAWQVLQYVDKKTFADVSTALLTEFSSAPKKFRNYLQGTAKGVVPFWGIPSISPADE